MNTDIALLLYQKKQTVFSFKELVLTFPKLSFDSLKNRLNYLVKNNKIQNPRRGIYTKKGYNLHELAVRIYTPSYISLESILAKEGLIFQNYKTIFCLSYLTRKISVDGIDIQYRKITDRILFNQEGIFYQDYFYQASKERAFLDAVFLYKDYHFDNLGVLDWIKIRKNAAIYQNKVFNKRVEEYFQIYKKGK